MKALFFQLATYNKKKMPVFYTASTEAQLIDWGINNDANDYIVVDNFTQSPNSGQVSILKTLLDNESMPFPNYLVIYDSPLSRPFGYFLEFHGINSNLNSITFTCEIDPLFYPSITNAVFKCDIMKGSDAMITPNKIDIEKMMVGDTFEKTAYKIQTTTDIDLIANSRNPRGWIIMVSSGSWSGSSLNGLHYFIMPYFRTGSPKFYTGGTPYTLMGFMNEAYSASSLLSDTGLMGVYYVPHFPLTEAVYYDNVTDRFYISDPLKVEMAVINTSGGQMSVFKYFGVLSVTSSDTASISASNYNSFLASTASSLVPGEMSYAIGNNSYSEILHPLQINAYPYSTAFTINIITSFSDTIEQSIFTTYSNQTLLRFPKVQPIFKNDAYLTFMKNQSGILWASTLLGIGASTAGALMGDVSSMIGLGQSVTSGLLNIASQHEKARQQRDSVLNSNNLNILVDSMIRNDYQHYYGYRYNANTLSYNRFSAISPTAQFTYASTIEYIRFTEIIGQPLYTELERAMLETRGVVTRQ